MSLFQSLVSGRNETNPNQWKDSGRETTDEAVLGGSRDDHETGLVGKSSSGVSKKKLRRMTGASDQNFLDYLLNFDLNSVCVVNTGIGSMSTGATPLNKNVYENPSSSPAVCEDTYHAHAESNLYQECSNPKLPTSCQNEVRGSCADEQSLTLERSSESSGSQSLLIGLIHDQGLSCSPEPQVDLKKIGQVKPTNKQLPFVHLLNPTLNKTVTTQLHYKESQQEQISLPLPSFDSNAVSSKWSKTNTDLQNSVAYRQVLVGPQGNIFTELSPVELYCQSNSPEKSIKQLEQKQGGEVTLFNFSHDIHAIVCNEKVCGGSSLSRVLDTTLASALKLQASSLCEEKQLLVSTPSRKSPKDDQININCPRKSPLDGNISAVPLVSVCAKDHSAVENDDAKSSADSDCTVIEEQEQLKTTHKGREDVTIQATLNPTPVRSTYEGEIQDKQSCKTSKVHRGEPTESTTDSPNTESSVSMLTDLSQKPVCLLPTPDTYQGTESAGQDGFQKAAENEEASYTAKLSQSQKKRSKSELRKQTNHADVLHAGNTNANKIFQIGYFSLLKVSGS